MAPTSSSPHLLRRRSPHCHISTDMQPRGLSFFLHSANRELHGSRVRKRPCLGDLTSETGTVKIEHEGTSCPPLAVSYCKSSKNSHLLAVSDEDGYVTLWDTRGRFASSDLFQDRSGDDRIRGWLAHDNAIFDVCWMKEDALIVTGSGDQTIRIWDIEKKKCIGIMAGHKGSVKSLCSQQSHSDLLVSGSRDGSFALWDLRCKSISVNSHGEACYCSTATVLDPHRRSSLLKRTRRGKVASMSITSVLYLKDDISIASATDVDSVVKFWDSRQLKSFITQTSPFSKQSAKEEKASHGVSSLSQNHNGTFLAASCMDNMIYLYDTLHLDNGPVKSFSGGVIGSFYVKAAISPDAGHILSGSSDKGAYIWQVDRPDIAPVQLRGHDGEVTAVDWCSSEIGKIATSSDDCMVRIWSMKNYSGSCPRSPITNRKRISAISDQEFRNVTVDNLSSNIKDNSEIDPQKHISFTSSRSPTKVKQTQPHTPESTKKLRSSCMQSLEEVLAAQKTPEPTINSPSSVLNPPPSLKRTIRDYFLAAA